MKELKIELLKQGSKKRDIKKEIARILTLQQNKVEEKKK
jgi:ribosomal protein L29